VDRAGLIEPEAVRLAIRPETILITLMHANNELGTVQPLAEIGRIAAEADVISIRTRCNPWANFPWM